MYMYKLIFINHEECTATLKKSIVYHVAGIHEWPDFQLFSACRHNALNNDQRRNKLCLPIGSPEHNALKEVTWKPKLLKDVCLLADFVQSGCLEVFYGSMAKKYVNKSQHYSYNGIWLAERSWLPLIQTAMWGKGSLQPPLETSDLSKATETVGRESHIWREDISVCPWPPERCHFTEEGWDWSSPPWKATPSIKYCTISPWKQRRRYCKACVKISINFSVNFYHRQCCYIVWHKQIIFREKQWQPFILDTFSFLCHLKTLFTLIVASRGRQGEK